MWIQCWWTLAVAEEISYLKFVAQVNEEWFQIVENVV